MQQLAFSLFVFVSLAIQFAHAGPIVVGNGGGQGEYSVVFARTNLLTLLKDCDAATCGLDPFEEQLLWRLVMGAERHVPNVVIKSEKEMGSVPFVLNGLDVDINQDLLWLDQKRTVAYGLAEAVALWIRILAVQESFHPDQFLAIQSKALVAFANYVQRGQQLSTDNQSFEYLMWKRADIFDLLLVRDPFLQEIDVTNLVAAKVGCVPGATSSLKFFSPSLTPGPGGTGPLDDYVLTLDFGVKWACGSSRGNSIGRAVVTAKRTEPAGPLKFDPNSVFVHVETGGVL